MLADDVLAAVGGLYDQETHGGISNLARWIGDAQRFVFDPEIAVAMAQVARVKPSSLLDALPMARPPFRDLWLDVPMHGLFPGEPAHAASAKRAGIYITCEVERHTRFVAIFALSSNNGSQKVITLQPFSIKVDLLGDVGQLPGIDGVISRRRTSGPDREIEQKLFRHIGLRISRLTQRWFEGLDDETAHAQLPIWQNSLQTLVRMTIASLAMLNSRNLIRVQDIQHGEMNKARKRSGKRELLSYSEVRIDLSKREKVKAAELKLTSAEIRQHIVRGHFKVRKGGIYWWRPFLRGSVEIGKVMRTGYSVRDRGVLAGVPA